MTGSGPADLAAAIFCANFESGLPDDDDGSAALTGPGEVIARFEIVSLGCAASFRFCARRASFDIGFVPAWTVADILLDDTEVPDVNDAGGKGEEDLASFLASERR